MHSLTPLIEQYLTHRIRSKQVTPDTAATMRASLTRLARAHGNRQPSKLGPATIDRWAEGLGNLRATTRSLHAAHVRTFCRWLVHQRVIGSDPTSHLPPIVKPRRDPVTLTRSEVAALYRHVHPNPRSALIVALLHGLGARCVEVARLTIEDYDPTAEVITLTGKGGHQRTIPVPASVSRAIARGIGGRRSGPMIPSTAGGHLQRRTITIMVGTWMTECGVKRSPYDGKGAHSLRRTAATELLDEGADIRDAQELLGHADPATTLRHYQRRTGLARLREAMDRRDFQASDGEAA